MFWTTESILRSLNPIADSTTASFSGPQPMEDRICQQRWQVEREEWQRQRRSWPRMVVFWKLCVPRTWSWWQEQRPRKQRQRQGQTERQEQRQVANLFGTESAPRVRTEIQLLCMTCDCHEVKTEMVTQLNAECGKPLHPTSACISNAMLLYRPSGLF